MDTFFSSAYAFKFLIKLSIFVFLQSPLFIEKCFFDAPY